MAAQLSIVVDFGIPVFFCSDRKGPAGACRDLYTGIIRREKSERKEEVTTKLACRYGTQRNSGQVQRLVRPRALSSSIAQISP